MLPKKYQKGFIDPLSLFAIGFLVVSLIVGTKVVTDRQKSLDIRNEAKMIADCTADSDCGSGYKCISGSCEKIPTISTPAPTTRPAVTEEDKLTFKEEFLDPGTPAPTAAPSCKSNGKCIGPGERCCTGKSYFDIKCAVTETRCGTKTSASSDDASLNFKEDFLDPEIPESSSCVASNSCIGPGEKCCGGSYFDTSCAITETRCGTKPASTPSSTKAPAATPAPVALKSIGSFCLSDNECASGYCTYDPGGDKWCQAKPSVQSSPYCSSYMNEYCPYGCNPNTSGGYCKNAPVIEEAQKEITLKGNGEICNRNSDCQSGVCQYASFGQSICVVPDVVLTEEEQQQQTEELLTGVGQFLNTITFGAFGNYISTYAEINQELPESSYLERAFSQEGLAASTELGTILTAEGAALWYTGAALGGVSLAEIPISTTLGIPSLGQSLLYASATAESILASLPSWAPGAIRTTGVVLGNLGIYQGTRACQEDPSSFECASMIAGIQMGWMDDLAQETGAFVEDAFEATSQMIGQSLDDAQVVYAFEPNMRRLMDLGDESADEIVETIADSAEAITDLSGGSPVGSQAAPSLSQDVPTTVTLETGEVITIGEQIGSSGVQGSAYAGQTCSGQSCVVKLYGVGNNPGSNFTDDALTQINQAQLEIMSTYGTAENTFLPEYYGAIVDEAGETIGYAMQRIEGETVRSTLQSQGGLTGPQITAIDDSIRSYHSATGQPHGDILNPWYEQINTGNIMLTPEGQAVLIDPAGPNFQSHSFYTAQEILQIESLEILQHLREMLLE